MANAAPRINRFLIPDDYPAVTVSDLLPIAGGPIGGDDPHTPRIVSSTSEVPAVVLNHSRRYMPDPNSPSPSARGEMHPPPSPLRVQPPFSQAGGAIAASAGQGPGHWRGGSGQAATIPTRMYIRPQSFSSVQPSKRDESGSQCQERRKRSHEEYEVDAGAPTLVSSSKHPRTLSEQAAPPSDYGMQLQTAAEIRMHL